MRIALFILIFCLTIHPSRNAVDAARLANKDQSSIDARRKQLNSLFDEEWEYELQSEPEFTSALGDKRYNDRLSDRSLAFFEFDFQRNRDFLSRFEAIDGTDLPAQAALSLTLMVRLLRQEIANSPVFIRFSGIVLHYWMFWIPRFTRGSRSR